MKANRIKDHENVNYYYYLNLLQQEERILKFQKAIASVAGGKKVVEIGAGVGTYSFFAARSAEHVYAIEQSDIIKVAKKLAKINKLEDTIEFIKGNSLEVELPEKCDILVLENFSSLFLRRDLEEVIHDASSRFLKDQGVILPGSVSLFACPIETDDIWKKISYLDESETSKYGLDFSLLREMMLSNPHVMRLDEAGFLAEPIHFLDIDLALSRSFLFDEVMEFRASRSGRVHGIAAWFELNLIQDITLSNSPANRRSTWGQVFFPVKRPLQINKADPVAARLACTRSNSTGDIWWSWQLSIPSGTVDQSSFKGIAFWPGDLE